MTIHFNKSSEKTNRRKLRRNSTEAEEILWEHLKDRKLFKMKFRRQYSIDQFVIDFYCPKIKFAIELDGKIHLDKNVKNHDENRDGFLSNFGIKILRIKNDAVLNDIDGKIESIKKNITLLKQTSSKS